MSTVRVAAVAYEGSYDLELSVKSHLDALDELAAKGADLVVFPEVSLQGYPPEVARIYPAKLLDVYGNAQPVPGGDAVDMVLARASELGLHVVFGCNELGDRTGAVYDTVVLGGPDGFIGKYRKVHLGITEQPVWRPGDDWPVFDTAIGRIGMMICYDELFPESARELTLRGAEILVHPKAGPRVLFQGAAPRDSESTGFIGQARAAENSRWVVTSNFAGSLGQEEFTGVARIIDPTGRVVAATEPVRPGVAMADIDVKGGIASAYAHLFGARLVRDRRPDTYRVLSGSLPPAIDA